MTAAFDDLDQTDLKDAFLWHCEVTKVSLCTAD